jgi:predicted dehydrogenase
MGKWHASAAQNLGHTVTAVCDADPARALALATEVGAPTAATAADACRNADVVHVCTPPFSHASIVSEALHAGCHVICEKPLALSADDVRRLHALAASRELLLVPTHQFVFQRGFTDLLAALPSLGTVLHIDLTACTAGATGRDAAGAESVAMEVLPHPMSMIERLRPGSLQEMAWYAAPSPLGDLRVTGTHRETTIGILISCGGRPPINQLRVICAGGTVVVDLFHGFATIDRGGPTRHEKIARPFTTALRTLTGASVNLAVRSARREPAYPGLRELVHATYAAIAAHAPAPISAHESVEAAIACDSIRMLRPASAIAGWNVRDSV